MAYVKNNKVIENIKIKDAELIFKNFSGRKREVNGRVVNEEGNRNFCVIIPDDIAEKLQEDGWNIKILAPRNEGDSARYFLPVALNFNYKEPPVVTVFSGEQETVLDEESIDSLDFADIKKVVLTIRPRIYDGSNIKAYLQSMGVVIARDELLDELREWCREEE